MSDPLRGPLQQKIPATGRGAIPNTTIVAPGPDPETPPRPNFDPVMSDGKPLVDHRISNDHKTPV
jgi:hypothetical protein